MRRLVEYVVYVIGVSLLASLSVSLTAALFAPSDDLFSGPAIMGCLPMALALVPYTILQVVVAAILVRPLSMLKLFALSAMLLLGVTLLGVAGAQIPPGIARQVVGGVFATLSNQFNLLIPVLVLALIARKRPAAEPCAAPSPAPTGASDSTNPPQGHVPVAAGFKWRWFYWDIALMSVPLWFGILFDSSGILSYLGGLINVPFALEGLMLSVMLIPLVPLCLVGLLVRMLIVWPKRIRGWIRLLVAWAAVAIIFSAFVLPFVFRISIPMESFMNGFKKHVQWRTDIDAIQAWLGTLDPNGLDGRSSATPIEEPDLPSAVTRLRPWSMGVTLDDKGRPMIRLSWGSGMMGGWGLVVGDKNMEMPPSDLSRFGEYRDPIAPGAYVWREID